MARGSPAGRRTASTVYRLPTEGTTVRWTIPWDAITAARIVDGGFAEVDGRASFLAMELDPAAVPADPSLHLHEGAWWFRLLGTDVPARLHHELGRRIPGRVGRARSVEDVPRVLAGWGRST